MLDLAVSCVFLEEIYEFKLEIFSGVNKLNYGNGVIQHNSPYTLHEMYTLIFDHVCRLYAS